MCKFGSKSFDQSAESDILNRPIMEYMEKSTLQEKEVNGESCLADAAVKEVGELIEATK